jgi:hypothetical protein
MNEPPVPPAAAAVVEFKDRRTGLIVFGVLEILLGGLAALMVPLMLLGQIMSAKLTQEPPPLRQMIPGAMFYGIAAVLLVWLGIGSCKTRRWARALSLVVSWSWLGMGVFTVVVMGLFLPSILKTAPPQGQALPESARLVVMIVTWLFMGFLFVVVPGVLVLFYQRRDVKATCEARHPVRCWTDAAPLPVLGLSLWLGLGALTMLSMPLSTSGVLPVFGRVVSGLAGSLCCLSVAALLGYSA